MEETLPPTPKLITKSNQSQSNKKKEKSKLSLEILASSTVLPLLPLLLFWVHDVWCDCFMFFVSLPLSVDLRSAINFAPTSEEDSFLASAKASRLPLGVKVRSGILKVFTCPSTPLTHSSCSASIRGSICTGRKIHAVTRGKCEINLDTRGLREESMTSVSHAQQLQKWHTFNFEIHNSTWSRAESLIARK